MENPITRIEAHQKRVDKMNEEIEMLPNGIALDLLQAIYRSNEQPLHTRMRAAGMAIPYESPKLIATAIVNEGSFAELLDRRIKRMQEMKIIEAEPTAQTDAKPPFPRLPDR